MEPQNILILAGTRPEAIKLAPVVSELRKSETLEPILCASGQHRELLYEALEDFGLRPDIDLAVMRAGQSLTGLAGRLFTGLEKVLAQTRPAAILVQGDTTTALAGAMAGFFSKIPVGHVEAGLRSNDMTAPWPEEFNRRAAALAATWHFAPTPRSQKALLGEGVCAQNIFITGNTVVDALKHIQKSIRENQPQLRSGLAELVASGQPYVLVTCHRRENFGAGVENVCLAIQDLAVQYPGCHFVFPLHPNPAVNSMAGTLLENIPNVLLVPPCPYKVFLWLLENCLFIMSDSGGVQEEAPSFSKKALVLRDVTERPEGVEAGFCRLVGTRRECIVMAARETFANPHAPAAPNPFGDGFASSRIIHTLEEKLGHLKQEAPAFSRKFGHEDEDGK